MSAREKKTKRLSREDWLHEALLDLAADGVPKTIDYLVDKLGVTKGSFYHHFTDREDFIVSLANFWDEEYTRNIADTVLDLSKAPKDNLWRLMREIDERGLGALDLPMRNLALQNTNVAAVVTRVDRYRLAQLRRLFAAMGFKDEALEARTYSFVTQFSLSAGIYAQVPKSRRKKHLKALHSFYTRP